MSNELNEIRDELRSVRERLEVLETRAAGAVSAETSTSGTTASDEFWALSELASRRGDHPETVDGAVMLVGSLTLPPGAPVSWQQSAGTAGLLASDWSAAASVFAALGHPVRLELLRQILAGVHGTADLAAIEALGTTGQLHHHLRQLVAAGWVQQSGRGTYEVPATRVVPLLACLAGARR